MSEELKKHMTIPSVLFDGYAIYQELTIEQRKNISHRELSDVLDAIVRMIRREVSHAGRL